MVAPRFLDWMEAPPRLRWLDIGCGTGALSQTVLGTADPDLVVGVDPSPAFVAHADEQSADPRLSFQIADAMALPFEDANFDVCVSGLVLNFVPDAGGAVAEMRRVTRASGLISAYVWDYAGEMQLMRHFWSAAGELDSGAIEMDEGVRFKLCRPDRLHHCFEEAGLSEVAVTNFDIDTVFRDFDDYWQPFLGGQGPAPAYLAGLGAEAQARLRELVQSRLPIAADGSIPLIARAWAVKGRS